MPWSWLCFLAAACVPGVQCRGSADVDSHAVRAAQMALAMMRRSVRKRAGFSIDDVSPLNHAGESFIPALFGEPASWIVPCSLGHCCIGGPCLDHCLVSAPGSKLR